MMNKEVIKNKIPTNWSIKKIGEILKIKHGKNQKEIEVLDGKYPILATGGVIGRTNTPLFSKPSVLIGRKGTIDKPRYMETPFWTVDTLFYSDIKTDYHPKWLYYYFCTIPWRIYNEATGVPSLSASTIESIKIKVPTYDEQVKIANILSIWDKAIELKEKLIEHKKEQKKGLMQKLLTGEVRLPGFKGTWEIKRIKNISKVSRGASPRPISDPKWFDLNSKIGWVRISDVTKSKKTLFQTEQYLSDEGVKKSRLVEKGNIIMSICATVGKPIVTGFNVCIHDGFVVFDALKINRDYFYYALLRIENYWEKYGQTGSQMNLNTDIVGNEKIMFPNDYDEQKAIAEVLMNADKEIELIEDELEYIKQQKKGLMQLLLTGKVRVQV